MSNTLFPQVTVFSAIQEEGIKVPEFMLWMNFQNSVFIKSNNILNTWTNYQNLLVSIKIKQRFQ
jgi:hypothetical protein